ncbi:MAG: histidinol-phosphate transaminase [Prolixibacteraceae bacterium]|jgi:histidinol-phosphate aminotransferase|nr:histidinol-phosphate transaminase [Prolixibacteraceae bacterium]
MNANNKYIVNQAPPSGGWGVGSLLRPNIANLTPYSSARDEFSGSASVFLDANENPYETGYNRYPDPYQMEVKKRIAEIKGVQTEQIFLGNGSDEPIDLLFRAFCNPGVDNVVAIEPSYGMYTVSAGINDVEVKKVLLTENFELESEKLLAVTNDKTKLVFLCSPNNPSGNLLNSDEIINIVKNFRGIVIVDEAYIDFAPGKTLLSEINNYPNLVILQTFSKAWGLAGIRLGMAFTSPEIIGILNKIKYPYNINSLTQQKVIETLNNTEQKENWVKTIINERERLAKELKQFNFVKKIYPSDANFLLVKMDRAREIFEYLMKKGVIVRDRSKVALCEGSLRITVGSPKENDKLIQHLMLQQ